MCDDLNVAGAIGVLSVAIGALPTESAPVAGAAASTWRDELEALHRMDGVLGVLDLQVRGGGDDESAVEIESLIEARTVARDRRDWDRADELRDELLAMGIAIKDGDGGTSWERIVQ